jgi:hypothetical protein
MRRAVSIGAALACVFVVGAFASEASASASKLLTLSGEGLEGEALEPGTPFYDNEDGVVAFSFRLKGVHLRCEAKNALLGLEGEVRSNEGATDTLQLEHGWEEVIECASRGIEAELFPQRRLAWTVHAGADGHAELTGKVTMSVRISVGKEVLECEFQTAAMKGTDTATHTEKLLLLDFPAARNKLALEPAESSSGCPTTLSAGFDATGLSADVGEGAARMTERVQS